MYFELMADRTRYLKENPKGVSEMCRIMEDMRNESLKEGMQEEKKMTVLRMLDAGKYMLEEIANISGLSLEEVSQLTRQYKMRKRIPFIFILLLLFTMFGCSSKNTYDTKEDIGMSMGEIWKINDADDFIIELADYVNQKCEYGDNMEALSEPERIFFITQTCEMEVNNGGFAQFFYNSSGNFSGELINAFQEIGASKTAEICRTALNAFGEELPSDLEERRELLYKLTSDEIDNVLDECDDAFCEYEEDLNALNYAYVMKNKANFS